MNQSSIGAVPSHAPELRSPEPRRSESGCAPYEFDELINQSDESERPLDETTEVEDPEPTPVAAVMVDIVPRENISAAPTEACRAIPAELSREAVDLRLAVASGDAVAATMRVAGQLPQATLQLGENRAVNLRSNEPPRLCEVHLAQHIGRLVKEGVHSAVVRLSPEGLGVIDVRMTLEAHRLSVDFGSSSDLTRGLLEQSLPRLAELLTQGGISLAQASVVPALSRDGWVTMGRPFMTLERPVRDIEPAPTEEKTTARPSRRRLLDTYA
jgi:hypothetical protein